jgi:hypothetical protein
MAVKTTDTARILAALEEIPQGPAAVNAAANQILAALGVKASDLLRAKAAEFEEMAGLIDACSDSKSAEETEPDGDENSTGQPMQPAKTEPTPSG